MAKLIQLKDKLGNLLYPKIKSNSIIKVNKTANQSIAQSTPTEIIWNIETFKIGTGLELLNNKIYIRDQNIKAVQVISQIQYGGNANPIIYILKNGVQISNFSMAGGYVFNNSIIDVIKDDYISINTYTTIAAQQLNFNIAWTNLIVSAIY